MGATSSQQTNLLRRALSAARMSAWEWDPTTDVLLWLDASAGALAWPAGAPGSRGELLALLPPELREQAASAFSRAQESGELAFQLPSPSAPDRWLRLQGARLTDGGGAFAGVLIDCTDQLRQAQGADALVRLHSVLREIGQVLLRTEDSHSAFREACRIAVELGLVRFAWVGLVDPASGEVKPVAWHGSDDGYLASLHITVRDEPAGQGPTGQAIRSGQAFVCGDIAEDPRMLPWRDRALERGYRSSAALPLVGDGQPLGALNLYADRPRAFEGEALRLFLQLAANLCLHLRSFRLDEQRRAAVAELARREAELRSLIETAGDAIFVADPTGRFLDANSAATKLVGYSREELRGLSIRDLVPAEEMARRPLRFEDLGTGHTVVNQRPLRRRDGTVVWVEMNARALPDGRLLGIARDLTERLHQQEQLALLDRMATIGTLTAGVAHEISNPMTFVLANLDLLRRELDRLPPSAAPRLAEPLQDLTDGVERIRLIVRDLKTLSRAGVRDRVPLELREVLEATVRVVEREVRQGAELEMDYRPVPRVLGSTGRLGQLFLNLLVNAGQATVQANGPARKVRLSTWTDERGWAVAEVADTGVGIAPELLPRIFEPFFTTKPPGQGTGLGLSICRAIVEEHGGRLEVESRLGEGSRFRVALPPAP